MILRGWISAALLVSEPLFAQVKLPAKAFAAEAKDYDRGTYAAIDFPLEPYSAALKHAEELAGGKLQTRGEAHLTVLTPLEYMRIEPKIRKKILEEFKDAMKSEAPRQNQITPVCIGRGSAEVQGKTEFTYFVVVEAKALKAVREKYHLLDFYPHVTLGFTKRDLHFEDGVKKDKSACVADTVVAN